MCNDKIVGASWFVSGFGEDRLASDEPLSPRDVRGHGTQMASIAAGNAEVSVDAPGLHGSFGGVAPRARLAVYKACWSAPDPRDDGCSTADLVTAVDRATRDGVDVLNLSVAGGPASTPSNAPCSVLRRPGSSWWPRPATTAPAATPATSPPG